MVRNEGMCGVLLKQAGKAAQPKHWLSGEAEMPGL